MNKGDLKTKTLGKNEKYFTSPTMAQMMYSLLPCLEVLETSYTKTMTQWEFDIPGVLLCCLTEIN